MTQLSERIEVIKEPGKARPKEISALIKWLREPGRELLTNSWADADKRCSMGRLYELCGVDYESAPINSLYSARLRIGVTDEISGTIYSLNDRGEGPIAVAAYLERAFPESDSQ